MNTKTDPNKQIETVKAWHFLPNNSRTRYSDEPVKVGTTLFANGEIVREADKLAGRQRMTTSLQFGIKRR